MRAACHDNKSVLFQNSKPSANRVAMHMTCLRCVPVAEKYLAIVVTVKAPLQFDIERSWTLRHSWPCHLSLGLTCSVEMANSFCVAISRQLCSKIEIATNYLTISFEGKSHANY